MENDELSQLEELLNADINNEKQPQTSDVDIFKTQGELNDITDIKVGDSVVHNGDTDSSDDEEKRNCIEKRYHEYGTDIKKILDHQEHEQINKRLDFETRLRQTNLDIKINKRCSVKETDVSPTQNDKNIFCAPDTKCKTTTDIYTDPIFGIRITKPIISSSALLDRMQGREVINMLSIKRHVEHGDLSRDWVMAGVIVRKSTSKKSQKGSQFIIWTLSDLKDDLKTVSVFLFRKAYNDLWKTVEGTVVAILNPNVLDRSENSRDQACLSLDNPDRCMILGQSKDLGTCKSRKKNGEPCTAFVNTNKCEHCIYHVQQEYQKYSRRQELQSPTMGKGLVNLQNKVLGKNTIIYGGKAYSAVSSTKHVSKRDQNRLMSLSDYYKSEGDKLVTNCAPCGVAQMKTNTGALHSPTVQRTSDLERLNNLTKTSSSTLQSTTSVTLAQKVRNSPKLGGPMNIGLKGSGVIDLNISYGQKIAEKAKFSAINVIKQCGGIKKIDPNNTRGTEMGKKRAFESMCNISDEENKTMKKPKNNGIELDKNNRVMSERFKKILEATSAHQNLIQRHEDEEQEKYFNKLEKKEAMEEKMLNTFKLECKAVRCVNCKYTAFSAAQRCKDEKHSLKVINTFKRFFKCKNCGNRTVSLDIIPLTSCSNCKSSKWEKAPMMREKKVTTLSDGLSIRGEEETFVGGQITTGKNINLLVPDVQ